MVARSSTQMIVFLLGVIMGTASTITIKVMYDMRVIASDGVERNFNKPLTTTWCMFIAMLIALPLHFVEVYYANKALKAGGRTENTRLLMKPVIKMKQYFPIKSAIALILPSIFDLVGTALSQVGLMYCTVSVFQLVRCTVMIIVALMKTCILKEKLRAYMWWGVGINTMAMVMVALTTVFQSDDAGGSSDAPLGILFLLMSCCVQGGQYVFEEKMMSDFDASPLLVVGMEGLWGAVLMPVFVFPIAYLLPGNDVGGSMENVRDAFHIANNNPAIMILLLSFIAVVFFYNVFAVYVTHLLSSVWHAILDNFRPVSVWGTDLLLYYVFCDSNFGEPWIRASYLQLAGMSLLFVGTAVYNATLKIPCLDYHEIQISSSTNIQSPALMASPLISRGMSPRTNPVNSTQPAVLSSRVRTDSYGTVKDEKHRSGSYA